MRLNHIPQRFETVVYTCILNGYVIRHKIDLFDLRLIYRHRTSHNEILKLYIEQYQRRARLHRIFDK